jgi:hypothetical protein
MAQTNDFKSFANEHPNYFPGQYLLEDDFELQHKYLSDRQRYHNQILHISGIIEGLEVEASSDKKSVQIKSGTAIDGNGELIVLKNDTSFDLKNVPNGDGELYIKFSHEYKKESKQQKGVDASSTRWIEEPIINFAATAPENSIKLLKLTISDNAITNLDLSIRIYSGVSLPNPNNSSLTLRSGGNANPNLALLTGSLKIDGDLAVKGTGTSSFAGNLTINGNIVLSDFGKQIQLIKAVTADGTTAWGTIQADTYVGLQIGFPDSAFGGRLQIGTLTSRGERKFNELMLIEANGNTSIRGNLTINGSAQLGYESTIPDFGSPLMSGFYQNDGKRKKDDLPDTDNSWIHLITARHSTTGNNHQLQIAATYTTNDRLFFRKIQAGTSVTSNPGWNEVATRGKNEFTGEQNITSSLKVKGSVQLEGNVLIGIDNPGDYKLNVQGNQYIKGSLTITEVLAIGDKPFEKNTGGNREWMKKGITVSWDSDMLFVGLKDEASNRKDAVIAWGDDATDNLRFIHTLAGEKNEGNEALRITGNGNVGIGTGTNTPDAKLDVNGYIIEKLDIIMCGGRGDWTKANHPIKRYFQSKLSGKPGGTMMRALQNFPDWRGHYWEGWVDVDGVVRIMHNAHNTGHIANQDT